MTAGASGRVGLPGRLLLVVLGLVMLLAAAAVSVATGSRAGTAGVDTVDGTGTGTVTIAVRLLDMRIVPSVLRVKSGIHLILQVTNADTVRHDLAIEGGPSTPLLAAAESTSLDLGTVSTDLQGWCTVPGHRAAGMTISILVGDNGSAERSGSSTPTGPSGSTGHAGMEAMPAGPGLDDKDPGPDFKPYDPALGPLPGGREHRLTLTVADTPTEVAPGRWQTMWTYNGTAPGPTLHGRVGDLFTITLLNEGDMAHGIDFHAGSLAPDVPMRSIEHGQALTYQFVAKYSGAWLYHCSTAPMSLHIANGMYGAVIIDPPDLPAVDRQFVLVQSELYLGPENGIADVDKIAARRPDAVVFNGYPNQYKYAPITVGVGERIRVWVVVAGPQFGTSFHVVGAQFDTVFAEGRYLLRPGNAEHGAAQTLALAPAQGGFVEFVLPEAGHYSFLDHAMVDGESGAMGTFVAH